MALVSVSQAARLAGVSRQHLYRKFIKTGQISVSKGDRDEPLIDTSEVLRVFGRLQGDSLGDDNKLQKATHEKRTDDSTLLSELQVKLQLVEAENRALRERIEDKDKHLDDVRQAMRLLEDKSEKKKRWKWW
jgi:AraC-like DNA-binding protein